MSPAKFREWRDRLGWSQARVAEAFKVSRNTVQNWESGTNPLSPAIQALCSIWEREHKKRPEYGPVVLIYADGRIFRSPYSAEPVPYIRSESFETMGGALARVDELWGRPDFQHAFIQDEHETLWNSIELQQRFARLSRLSAS